VLRGRSDEALVSRVRAGDDRAFEIVFDRYHRGLLAFCTHMLGSREEAEDALQHTFMAAYRSMRRTSGAIRLKAWLYTIARNRCLSMLRARREQVAFDETRAATDGLAADVDRRAQLRGLLADLERLPDDQRAALVLFELGDHAHDEIAEILGVRREKVKALVFQARESLASWRRARETPCTEIREQLATLRGAALKRATLRRHIARCESCRDFETEVRRQRRALAAALPIVPTAGLKAAVLTSVLGGGGAAAAGGGAAVTGLGAAKGIAAKTMLCAAIAGSAGSAGYVAVRDIDSRLHTPPMRAQTADKQHKTHHKRAAAAKPAAQFAAAPATATIAAAPAKAALTKPSSAAAGDRGRHGRGGERGRHRGLDQREREGWRGKGDRDGLRRGSGERGGAGERSRGGERRGDGQRGEGFGRGGERQAYAARGGGSRQGGVEQRAGGKQGGGKQRVGGKQGGSGNSGGRRSGQGRDGGSRHAGVSPR
jgi:RNA polymerase sigma factor (sigma-70 family)